MKGLSVQNFKIKFPEYQLSTDDFNVSPGEFFSIDAPSGFGKTTFLRGLLGFQPTTSGEVLLNERSIEKLPAHERGFGVVFQDHLLFSHLNAMENALFGLKIRGQNDNGAKLRAANAFAALGLQERMNAPIHELSGGERQRVALLRATLFGPEALILDEPLKGMDGAAIDLVVRYLKEQVTARPIPVIWISHQGTDLFSGGRIIGTERAGSRHFTLARN